MYQLTDHGVVIRLADGAQIPADPRNGDYRDFRAWQAAGNVPLPASGGVFITSLAVDDLADALVAKGVLTRAEVEGRKR